MPSVQGRFSEETQERIKSDSFYGQTHISLSAIEARLEALRDALTLPGLEALLEGAVEARRQALEEERRRMRAQLALEEGARPATWLAGSDDLAPGSFDLLTVRMLYPA